MTEGSAPTFNRICKVLNLIRDISADFYRNNVQFNVVLTPPYRLLEVEKFFSENELVKENRLFVTYVSSTDTKLDLSLSEKEEERHHKDREELKRRYIRAILAGEPDSLKLGKAFFEKKLRAIHNREMTRLSRICRPNGICIPGGQKLFVDVDGKFYMCERVGQALPLGDVYKGIDEESCIAAIKNYCDLSLSDCVNCWAIRLCRVCFANATKGKNLDINTKRRTCKEMRQVLHESLEIYATILEHDPNALDFLIDRKKLEPFYQPPP
jgi:uncharacterized protein